MPRRRVLTAVLVLAIATAAAAGVVVVARGGDNSVSTPQFLAQVHTVCTEYGERLDTIEPPTDLTLAVDVHESLAAALPVLREEAEAVRAIPPPPSLKQDLAEFFDLTDRSLVALEASMRAAGERALYPMATALWRFEDLRDQAKLVATRIGFDC